MAMIEERPPEGIIVLNPNTIVDGNVFTVSASVQLIYDGASQSSGEIVNIPDGMAVTNYNCSGYTHNFEVTIGDSVPNGTYQITVHLTGSGFDGDVSATLTVNREEIIMPDTNTNLSTDPVVQFTEAQVQTLVTAILSSVNERIVERIVQTMVPGDTKHVPSAAAVDTALKAITEANQANADAIDELEGKVGDGTDAAKDYTDQQINALRTALMGMNHWNITAVTGSLPEELDDKTIYMQRDSDDDPTWEMFVLADGKTVNIGNTSIDLENYWAKDNVDGLVTALFDSELFVSKLAASMSTALEEYTENTLDDRYWKKDDISGLVSETLADDEFKAGLVTEMSNDFYQKNNADDITALIQFIKDNRKLRDSLINALKAYTIYAEEAGGISSKVGSNGLDDFYVSLTKFKELLDAAGSTIGEPTYPPISGDENGIENDVYPVDNPSQKAFDDAIIEIIKKYDQSGTYTTLVKLKELLGIEGDLTADSVEQAIVTIVQKNEVESVPITDEAIDRIVSNAFALTTPDLTVDPQ